MFWYDLGWLSCYDVYRCSDMSFDGCVGMNCCACADVLIVVLDVICDVLLVLSVMVVLV